MSDLVDLLRRAINDPGQFCPRDRWPDTSGISKWEYETVGAWGARAAAIALADAGLLPPGGETRKEWAAQIWLDGQDPDRGLIDERPQLEALGVVEAHAARRALNPPETDITARRWCGNARLMVRTVHIGPWEPAPEQEAPDVVA